MMPSTQQKMLFISPPGKLQEAQPTGCHFHGIFEGKSNEQTNLLCSITSVTLLSLFNNVSSVLK